jgi:hypothetical protein
MYTNLAPFRWTFSSWFMSCFKYVSQTDDAYSKCGRTNDVKALLLTSVEQLYRCLRSRFNILLSLPVMLLMCIIQVRSKVNSNPKYGWLGTWDSFLLSM